MLSHSLFLSVYSLTSVEQWKTAGVKYDYLKTEGGHESKLWRDYLPEFLEKVAGK